MISKFITKFISTAKNPLHRWHIEKSYNLINKKIDLSNIDNCGCCDKIQQEENIDEIILSMYCYSNQIDLDTIKHKL